MVSKCLLPRLVPAFVVLALPLIVAGQGQEAWDARLRSSIDANQIRENMRRLTLRPHHVGSAYDKDNAEWILAKFSEWGWDARDRDLRRAVPDPEGAAARDDRAAPLHGDARRAASGASIRRPTRSANSCPPTTRIRSTATSPARWYS